MALLDLARNKGLNPEVAHVNYHKRPTAMRDQQIVEDYCAKYQLELHVLDGGKYQAGNFQDQARRERYAYFNKIVKERKLDGVLVAHHQDDLLETYVMQKEKNLVPSYYGLRRRNVIDGLIVIRPLLKKRKSELVAYCKEKGIEYGLDESNELEIYERNRVRHQLQLTENKRQKLLDEIKARNQEKALILKDIKHFIGKQKRLSLDKLLSYPYLEELLCEFLKERLSKSHLLEIERQLREADDFVMTIGDKLLVKEYGYLQTGDRPEDYEIVIDSIKTLKHRHFRLAKKGSSFEGVSLKAEDFPLIIRNARADDEIRMKYGTKKLSRFFIDKKIPKLERLSYPVMLSSANKIILVPGLGCDVDHYSIKHNLFMIKL